MATVAGIRISDIKFQSLKVAQSSVRLALDVTDIILSVSAVSDSLLVPAGELAV